MKVLLSTTHLALWRPKSTAVFLHAMDVYGGVQGCTKLLHAGTSIDANVVALPNCRMSTEFFGPVHDQMGYGTKGDQFAFCDPRTVAVTAARWQIDVSIVTGFS